MFRDRLDAAAQLAQRLASYQQLRPLVVGIPRGAVPMAASIARALGGDLDVVLVRKLGMPGHAEFGLGAVDESGRAVLFAPPEQYGVDRETLQAIMRRELEVIARRRAAYTALRPPIDPRGRVVIVVDDGAATGSTLVAALDAVRRGGAARVVAAVPVASPEAGRLIRAHADEAVILEEPPGFMAVGAFYHRFAEVSDEDVLDVLRRGHRT